MKDKIEKIEIERCSHCFESQPGGFSHEDGFTNYSVCKFCGLTTRTYSHSDFSDREEAEREAEGDYNEHHHQNYINQKYFTDDEMENY